MFATIFVLLSLYPIVAAGVKRSRDRGRSGWFFLLNLIPVVNLRPLVEWLLPGTAGPNRHRPLGPPAILHTSPHSRSVSMTAAVLGVLVVLLHGGVTVFVVPTFEKMFGDLGAELPAGTQALFGLSQRRVLGPLLTFTDVGLLLIWFRLATKDWRRLLLGLVPMYIAITAALVGVCITLSSRPCASRCDDPSRGSGKRWHPPGGAAELGGRRDLVVSGSRAAASTVTEVSSVSATSPRSPRPPLTSCDSSRDRARSPSGHRTAGGSAPTATST